MMLRDMLNDTFGVDVVNTVPADHLELLYADIYAIIMDEDESARGAIRKLYQRIGGPSALTSYASVLAAGVRRRAGKVGH